MNDIKTVQLNLLKAFICICEKYKLNYFLVEGTCLGAVRHGGYIPWDDDIDVALPREDYNSFLNIAQDELPDYYFLQTNNTDPEYLFNFAKIRDSRTTYIEKSVKSRNINHGVYIDIFPLDFTSRKQTMIEKIRDLLCVARISKEFDSEASTKMKLLQIVSLVLIQSTSRAISLRNLYFQKYTCGDYLTNYCSAYGEKEIMPREYYGGGIEAKFEGLTVRIPANYDGYLRKLYDDYMTLPPVDQRIGHHNTEIIDLEKPYTEYMN